MRTLVVTIIALVGLAATSALADGEATLVEALGPGRYERCTNYLVVVRCENFDVILPDRIRAGRDITIVYEDDAKTIIEEFPVIYISTRDRLCRLHNNGDTIYISACRKLR